MKWHSTSKEAGFTLLEIMVVIAIMALSVSIVSLSVSRGGPEADVANEIERFLANAQFAGERAILSGESMGLILEPPSWQAERGQDLDELAWRYRWLSDSSQGWIELPNLPAISLPASIELRVEIDDLLWEYDNQIDRAAPIAAMYPSGDVSVIRIEFSDKRMPDYIQTIVVDEAGELVWLEAPDIPEDERSGF